MGRKGLYLMFVIIIKKSTIVDFNNGAGDGI
jgi:hypothetical protein